MRHPFRPTGVQWCIRMVHFWQLVGLKIGRNKDKCLITVSRASISPTRSGVCWRTGCLLRCHSTPASWCVYPGPEENNLQTGQLRRVSVIVIILSDICIALLTSYSKYSCKMLVIAIMLGFKNCIPMNIVRLPIDPVFIDIFFNIIILNNRRLFTLCTCNLK